MLTAVDHTQDVCPFPLLLLPTELIRHIGSFCRDYRLVLPTGALNRKLKAIFSDPAAIASRVLLHYQTPEHALIAEAALGNVEVLRFVCDRADVNKAVGACGARAALEIAAARALTPAIKLLLERGADVHRAMDAALMVACRNGNVDVVKLLLDYGADVGARAGACLADAADGHLETVRLLLERGADAQAQSGRPLVMAAVGGHVDIVKLLLDNGAGSRCRHVNRAFVAAAPHCSPGVLELLLGAGADLHARDDEAFKDATREGNLDVMEYLLDRGVCIHPVGDKALVDASSRGQTDVVKLLLERGACVDGEAIRKSRWNGHTDVLEILETRLRKDSCGGIVVAPHLEKPGRSCLPESRDCQPKHEPVWVLGTSVDSRVS